MINRKFLSVKYGTQILLYTSAISLLLTLAFIFIFSSSFRYHYLDNLKNYGFLLTSNLSISASHFLITESYPSLMEVIDSYKRKPNIESISISNSKNKIVADSDFEKIGNNVNIKFPVNNFYINESEAKIIFYEEVLFYDQSFGYVTVELSMIDMHEKIKIITIKGFITGAVVWLVSLFVGYLFVSKITLSLKQMVKVADSISKGDFSIKSSGYGSYEIIKLSSALNVMSQSLMNREKEQDVFNKKIFQIKQYLSNIIDSMPSVIVAVNENGDIMQWNLEAEKVTGLTSDQAIDKKISEVFPFLSLEMENIQKAIFDCEHLVCQKVTNKNQGETKFLNINIYPLTADGIFGAVIRIDDVTENEKKDLQLRQSQKMEMVGTLAGGLAHDFNNVLGGIIGTLSIIDLKLESGKEMSNEELKKYIELMKQAGDRAANMVSQLLTLSRKQELSLSSVDLNKSIQNVVKVCENSFDKSINIVTSYQLSPAIVNADPAQIEQVLLNFCVNASHAMTIMKEDGKKWGGSLNISISKFLAKSRFCSLHPEAKEQLYWIISIADNGVGMSKNTISHIFSPFFTTKGEGRGTGLGLSIVYNIIKQHDGFIEVYSEQGIGSKFDIYIPLHDDIHGVLDNSAKIKAISYDANETILVVDDEELMLLTADGILSECGYKVILAQSGKEAIEIFTEQKENIDAVLLDMAMPLMSGKDVFNEMKKYDSDIKVLLASGYRHDERVEEILQLGVLGFIQKPYTIESLAIAFQEILHN